MRKSLGDIPWKGDLRVPHCLTPGFELVEEYAMLLGGVVSSSSPIFIRQSQALATGGVDKVNPKTCRVMFRPLNEFAPKWVWARR